MPSIVILAYPEGLLVPTDTTAKEGVDVSVSMDFEMGRDSSHISK